MDVAIGLALGPVIIIPNRFNNSDTCNTRSFTSASLFYPVLTEPNVGT